MRSVLIRLIAGLLLLVVGLFIFINTFDIYPFKGYYVYECSLCGHQWQELTHLDATKTKACPNYGVKNEETGKREGACRKKLCAEGATLKQADGNYRLVGNVTNQLIVNTVGGVLAIAGLGLVAFTGYRYLMNRPSKKDED